VDVISEKRAEWMLLRDEIPIGVDALRAYLLQPAADHAAGQIHRNFTLVKGRAAFGRPPHRLADRPAQIRQELVTMLTDHARARSPTILGGPLLGVDLEESPPGKN
jgi:hypothetical protein